MASRYSIIRDRLFLTNQQVPLVVAEGHLRSLRTLWLMALGPATVLAGTMAWQWPAAKSKALGILLDRQVALTTLGAAAHEKGIQEVSELALKSWNDQAIPADERASRFQALYLVREQLKLSREGLQQSLTHAKNARASVPIHLNSRASWVDPLTGQRFPVGMPVEVMVPSIVRAYSSGEEHDRWLTLVALASRPNATPMPSAI